MFFSNLCGRLGLFELCYISFSQSSQFERALTIDLIVTYHRDVTAGATGVTAVAPKFPYTLTLFQPGVADSTPPLHRSHQKFPCHYISAFTVAATATMFYFEKSRKDLGFGSLASRAVAALHKMREVIQLLRY